MALAQDADEMSTWIPAVLNELRTHQEAHICERAPFRPYPTLPCPYLRLKGPTPPLPPYLTLVQAVQNTAPTLLAFAHVTQGTPPLTLVEAAQTPPSPYLGYASG